jgi:hypothetical protein
MDQRIKPRLKRIRKDEAHSARNETPSKVGPRADTGDTKEDADEDTPVLDAELGAGTGLVVVLFDALGWTEKSRNESRALMPPVLAGGGANIEKKSSS